ncbi:neuropeptide Y receptor type 1 [Arctopsyche grandis]|uniref:neuropeptide Y receptor type 1 n=1 Tax=Arctopsyche grandis TaxID=121162 RepID=UPI00406D7B24
MDASMFDFPNKIWTVRPLWEVVVEIILYMPILIGGVISNVTLLTMIVKYKRLQSPTNILIASMAGVDLVNLILCPWMLSVHHFYQNYVLGAVGCKMEAFLSASLLITGVMLLSIVSYDRLTAIVLPREKRLTKRGAYHLAILSIVIGIAFGTPFLVFKYYKERQWKNFLEKYCTEDVQILPIYWHVLLSTLVWLPMTVMISCYTAIFCKLDKYQKEILRREHPMSVNYKTRVARTLFVIVISFIVCRLPFTVLVFWRFQLVKETRQDSITSTYQMLWFVSHYLIYLNCAINPMIYGFNNENYKRAFGETQLYKWLSGKRSS